MRVHGTKLGAISTGRGLGDQLYDLAGQVPPLDLNFAGTKTLDPRVTHTRASSGTYVDSTGVLQTARTNLLLQSEDFSTTWTNVRSTDSTNTAIAPNGTLTADELIEDNASGLHFIFQQTTKASASNSYVFSVYVKRATSGTRNVMLALTDGTTGGLGAIFDPDDGSVALASANIGSTSGWSMATASPGVSAGNGWWRFSVAITSNTSTRMDAVIYMTDGTTISYLGDNNSNLYLWGAQLEQSATVGEYIPTTSTINSAPRFDHDPTTGESLGLLVEEQRTNLLVRSEEFDNAAWAPIGLLAFGSGSTANAIASPNGQITADLLTESTTTGTHQVQQTASVTIGQVYTCSVFCKLGPNAVRRIQLLVTNANFTVTPIATFDLTTGTVVSVVQGTASITSYANGWYRLVLNTIAATSTGVNGFHFRLVDTGTNNSYTGDGSAGLYLWGAQLEAGAFPTSYIPTTTAAVTRSADVASSTGSAFSSWYRQDEGSLFGQYVLRGGNQGTFRIWDGNGAGFNSWDIGPSATAGGVLGFTTRSNQGTNSGPRSRGRIDGATNLGYVVKHAAAIAANDFACYTRSQSGDFNNNTGSAVPASGEYLPPLVDRLTLANNLSASITISRLSYYPVRLPDAQLQALTQ